MTTLAERLRANAETADDIGYSGTAELLREGAAEIERLQTKVGYLMDDAKLRAGVVLSEENDRLIEETKRLRAENVKLYDALDQMVNPKRPDMSISVHVEGKRKP